MARANTIQTNFTSGELSPNMYGRVDVSKYFNGVRKLRNMVCLPQGGAIRRPGTYWIGSVYDAADKVTVRPFVFSGTDSYVLEFGDLVLQVWRNGALVATTPSPIVSPYAQADLAKLKFAQVGDVLFITHPNYYPRTLSRVSNTVWTFAVYANVDGPYAVTAPPVEVTLSSFSDTATVTANSAIFTTTGASKAITGAVTFTGGIDTTAIKITAIGHGFTQGDSILIANVGGVPEATGAWIIDYISADTFVLYSSKFNAASVYTSGGTAIKCSGTHVEYREDNVWKLAQIKAIPSASSTTATVYVIDGIVQPDATNKLTWNNVTGGGVYASNSVFFWSDTGKFVRPNVNTGTPCWAYIYSWVDSTTVLGLVTKVVNYDSATITVVISARAITGTLTAISAYFVAADVSRLVRLNYGSVWVPGQITAYTSATVVSVTLTKGVPPDPGRARTLYNNGRTSVWKIGAWGTTQGYPSVVSFHQNRIIFASNAAEPTTVWMGVSGDYYNFAPSTTDEAIVNDDAAITIVIVSPQVNTVRWLESGPVLLVGTEGAEWQVKPSSIQQTITPTNISVTRQTAYGSYDVTAYRMGSNTIFCERNGLKVRELAYDYSIDAFASRDLSILSEHLLRENGGVVDWCVQTNPYSFLWIVTGNGKLIGVTYEKEHDVTAWHLHDVGGTIQSCCVIPTATGEDELYLVVSRTINGVVKKYIERIRGLLGSGNNYSDCGTTINYGTPTYIGALTLPIYGNALQVNIVIDGEFKGAVNSVFGTVTVDRTGTILHLGYNSEAIVGILDPEGGSQSGTSQGKKKRISESVARVIQSFYFKIASAVGVTNETENLTAGQDPVAGNRTAIVPTTTPYGLVSGDIGFSVDCSFDDGGRFEIVQDAPYPLHITALMHKLNTNE